MRIDLTQSSDWWLIPRLDVVAIRELLEQIDDPVYATQVARILHILAFGPNTTSALAADFALETGRAEEVL
jgi:hypothetical protein